MKSNRLFLFSVLNINLLFFSFLLMQFFSNPVLAGEYSPMSDEVPLPEMKMGENGGWKLSTLNSVARMEYLSDGETDVPEALKCAASARPCIHVYSEGEKDLMLECTHTVPAAVGKVMLFKGWMRLKDGVGRLVVTLLRDGKAVNVQSLNGGNFASYESPAWSQAIVRIPCTGEFDQVRVAYSVRPVTEKMLKILSDKEGEPLSEDRAVLLTNCMDFFACEPELEIGEALPSEAYPQVEGYFEKPVEEKMAREMIAMPAPNGVEGWYLTWRFLKKDSKNTVFNIFRREKVDSAEDGWTPWTKINESPISGTTDFLDSTASKPEVKKDGALEEAKYEWKLVTQEGEEALARSANFEHGISIQLRDSQTSVSRMAIADLDGDGRMDYIFMLNPTGWVDPYYNYWHPSVGTLKLEAYTADGVWLWTRDLGAGIENGIWYSPFIAADLDGDGRAEVAVKTAVTSEDDSVSGSVSDSASEVANFTGRVDRGAEYLSIWDGMTGKTITRVEWPSRDGLSYNYYCRNMLAVAHLDGKTPILLALRGTYSLQKMSGWQFRNGKLEEKLRWTNAFESWKIWGRGAHTLHCTDVDGDGRDEIAVGTFILDDTGAVLWSAGLHHPDHLYIGDIIPNRPGLEVYWGIEGKTENGGMAVLDARTGEYVWKFEEPAWHIHAQGLCADIDPAHAGCECFGGEEKNDFSFDRYLWSAEGKLLQRRPSLKKLQELQPEVKSEKDLSQNDIARWGLGMPAVFWNADPQKELVFAREGKVWSYGKEEFYEPYFRFRAGTLVKTCDILGDWREELFVAAPGELRIYMTKIPAETRRTTLLQDANYRASIRESSMGYSQTPLLGESVE